MKWYKDKKLKINSNKNKNLCISNKLLNKNLMLLLLVKLFLIKSYKKVHYPKISQIEMHNIWPIDNKKNSKKLKNTMKSIVLLLLKYHKHRDSQLKNIIKENKEKKLKKLCSKSNLKVKAQEKALAKVQEKAQIKV